MYFVFILLPRIEIICLIWKVHPGLINKSYQEKFCIINSESLFVNTLTSYKNPLTTVILLYFLTNRSCGWWKVCWTDWVIKTCFTWQKTPWVGICKNYVWLIFSIWRGWEVIVNIMQSQRGAKELIEILWYYILATHVSNNVVLMPKLYLWD